MEVSGCSFAGQDEPEPGGSPQHLIPSCQLADHCPPEGHVVRFGIAMVFSAQSRCSGFSGALVRRAMACVRCANVGGWLRGEPCCHGSCRFYI